jgi:hypothetical protein
MPASYYYRIDFAHNTYTGEVEKDTREEAADFAELITVDRIVEDYGLEWNDAAAQLEAIGTVTVSRTPLEGRRPVLVNMLTGEKTVGPAGMSEEMLFGMMASH